MLMTDKGCRLQIRKQPVLTVDKHVCQLRGRDVAEWWAQMQASSSLILFLNLLVISSLIYIIDAF